MRVHALENNAPIAHCIWIGACVQVPHSNGRRRRLRRCWACAQPYGVRVGSWMSSGRVWMRDFGCGWSSSVVWVVGGCVVLDGLRLGNEVCGMVLWKLLCHFGLSDGLVFALGVHMVLVRLMCYACFEGNIRTAGKNFERLKVLLNLFFYGFFFISFNNIILTINFYFIYE